MQNHDRKKKIFIEALEQRIMLDGAGASTFLDLIDDRNQDKFLQKNSKKLTKFSENKVDEKSQILPFDQVARDQKRNGKQIVFIDSQVQDYQKLINAFNEDTEVYLIQSNEDGFKKIDSALKDNCDVSSLHIIGHGSAGKILFGNATLSNDTIQSYNQTLRSIGQCLTEDGDILFYGCNVASTDGGKTLISKISEVTKADIAASDDVTGKGGDWDLEKKIGIVETQNVKVADYKSTLANGVESTNDYVEEIHGATDFRARKQNASGQRSTDGNDFVIVRESADVSNAGTLTLDYDDDGNTSVSLDTSSNPVNSYLLFINDDHTTDNRTDAIGQVVFDNEIYGIMTDSADTIAMSNISKSGATYPTSGDTGFGDRSFEDFIFYDNDTSSSTTSGDWISIGSDTKTLRVGAKNGDKGDYIRVITAADNNAPVAANNTGTINEDATLSVSDGASSNDVTPLSTGTPENINSEVPVVTGLAFNPDGTKMFLVGITSEEINEYTLSTAWDPTSATHNRALDVSGKEVNPQGVTFNGDGTKVYIVGNGSNEVHSWSLDTAYSLEGVHATDDYHSAYNTSLETNIRDIRFNNDGTKMFVLNGSDDEVNEYTLSTAYDPSTKGSVTNLSVDDAGGSLWQQGMSFNADGTRLFIAHSDTNDISEYKLTTGFDLDGGSSYKGVYSLEYSGTKAISSIAFSHDGTKMFHGDFSQNEIEVHTLVSPYNLVANVSGEHDGDVLGDDTDADSDSLTVTSYRTGASEGSGTAAGSMGSALTGTYGQLTLNANGSYTYAANQSAADDLDAGDVVTDSFNYTVSDGTDTDIGTIVITVVGINDSPVGVNDTDSVNEDATVTRSSGSSLLVADDTDVDDHDTLTVTVIQPSGGSASSVSLHSSYNSSGTSVTGTYGTLTIGADGTYTYVADQSAADDLDASDTVTDVFTYTVWDGAATDTATLTITVTGVNDAPVAANNTGIVNEDGTLTVSDGASANSITTAAASHDSSPFDISGQEPYASAVQFNNDGTKMFVTGSGGDDVNEYTLSTAFDVSTASFVDSFDYSSQETNARALAFNNDGTKMFVMGTQSDDVNEYTLSTAFDVSTASFVDGYSLNDGDPDGLAFSADGTKMFVTDLDAGGNDDDVSEYTLTTGFDVSTASFVDSYDVSSQDEGPSEVQFNIDGTKMFVLGYMNDNVYEYTLSTGFDVSSASYVGSFDISSQEATPNGLAFSADGTKMFIVGSSGDDINEYSLVSPYSLINVTGEHDGDVLGDDTDADDSASLTVTSYRTGASEGSGTAASSVGSALTGTYGQLTLNANGSYTYVANQSAADDLDAGDVVTDSFNYTVSDGSATDTATIVITVNGINDTPAGVNDTDSVDANETTTATNGSSNDVLTDDTDADDSASLTVTAIQPSGGSSSSVSSGSSYNSSGTEVTGTYGTLTIGADGSYTYVADQDAADNIDSGSSETDVFTYTVSDGTDTTTATLTITVSGTKDTTTEIKETKKEKKEAKKEIKEIKKQRKKIKRAKRLFLKEFKLPKSSIARSAEFNQGLKLVDLVAESGSIDIKEGKEDINKLKAKFTDKSLKVRFKVFNDEGKEVQKYYGEMKDGSALPEWIKVDPKTGRTKTNIPKGEKLVEFKIIAVDTDNNKKQVTVIIDPEKIAKDKEILKEVRKTAKAKIMINKDGSIKLKSINKDGSVNKTTTDVINENKNFEDIVKEIKPNEFLKLEANLRNNDFVVELPDEIKTNFKSLKVVLKNGKEIPNWIKLNPISGEIIANPPENVEKVELKVIIENENGEVTVKDIEINFSDVNPETTEKLLDNDIKFMPLSDQLLKEQTILDNYGSQIINNL